MNPINDMGFTPSGKSLLEEYISRKYYSTEDYEMEFDCYKKRSLSLINSQDDYIFKREDYSRVKNCLTLSDYVKLVFENFLENTVNLPYSFNFNLDRFDQTCLFICFHNKYRNNNSKVDKSFIFTDLNDDKLSAFNQGQILVFQEFIKGKKNKEVHNKITFEVIIEDEDLFFSNYIINKSNEIVFLPFTRFLVDNVCVEEKIVKLRMIKDNTLLKGFEFLILNYINSYFENEELKEPKMKFINEQIQYYEKLRENLENNLKPSDCLKFYFSVNYNLGSLYYNLCFYKKALVYNLKAFEITNKFFNKKMFEFVNLYMKISSSYISTVDHKNSIKFINYAYGIIKHYPEDIPCLINLLMEMGFTYTHILCSQKGEDYLKQSEELIKKLYGEDDTLYYHKYYYIYSVCQTRKNNFEEALKAVNKCMDIRRKAYGENSYNYSNVLNLVSLVNSAKEILDNVLELYNKSLEILILNFGVNYLENANIYEYIAKYYASINNKEKAYEFMNKNLKLKITLLGDENIEVSNYYYELNYMKMIFKDESSLDDIYKC
jgi:tetratricopeptide (TPR) repeat protein